MQPQPRKGFLELSGGRGRWVFPAKAFRISEGPEIEDRAVNPDKKGEEVTEKLAGLSEELMNTPQLQRSSSSNEVKARGPLGSRGGDLGLASENLGDRPSRGVSFLQQDS